MKKLRTFTIVIICLFVILLIIGDGEKVDEKTAALRDRAETLTFVKSPNNKEVISTGGEGLPTTAWDPYIHVDEEGYHIFFTSIFCKEGDDYNFSFHPGNQRTCNMGDSFGSIAYGFSADKGLTWEFSDTPVIYGGGKTGWDDHSIETAHVTRIGNKLHLFYSGVSMDLESRFQIGKGELDIQENSIYKTLMTNKVTFSRPPKPFLASQYEVSDFDNSTQEPSVVVKDDRIELYWVGLRWKLPGEAAGAPGQGMRGLRFFRTVYDLDFNLIEQTEESFADGVNITEVKYFDNNYYLFYTTLEIFGGPFHREEKIGLMTSTDGLSWSKGRIILKSGPIDTYDGWGLFAPTVAQDGNDLVMFVTTLSVEDGVVVASDLQPGERIGIGQGTETVYGGIGRAVAEFVR